MAALRRGIKLSLTHIDTTELRGDGVVEEMTENAAAGDLRLAAVEIAEIDAVCAAGPPERALPML